MYQDAKGDLKPVIAQLGEHVDSMRTNLDQTADILPQMEYSKAALQDLLSRCLDAEDYEHVVLGS